MSTMRSKPSGFAPSNSADLPTLVTATISANINLQVLNIIRGCRGEKGASVKFIMQQLGKSETEIRSAIEFLSNEGHIFCTINDGNLHGCITHLDHYGTNSM